MDRFEKKIKKKFENIINNNLLLGFRIAVTFLCSIYVTI